MASERCPIGEIARFIGDRDVLQDAALRARNQAQEARAREDNLWDSLGIGFNGRNWRWKGTSQMEEIPKEEVARTKEEIRVVREEREFFGEV